MFDASEKTSTGISLNDSMMVGPTLPDDLFFLVSRFWFHQNVLTADEGKIYKQVNIHQQHLDLQRILWRETPEHARQDISIEDSDIRYSVSTLPLLFDVFIN